MSAQRTDVEVLFISNSGEVACAKRRHGGHYLESAVKNDPDAFEHITPLDHWYRISPEDVEATGIQCHECEEQQ